MLLGQAWQNARNMGLRRTPCPPTNPTPPPKTTPERFSRNVIHTIVDANPFTKQWFSSQRGTCRWEKAVGFCTPIHP